MELRALAYIRIESTDLERWRSFGTDILGMMIAPGISAEDRLYLTASPVTGVTAGTRAKQ